jgi:hypothetical protein
MRWSALGIESAMLWAHSSTTTVSGVSKCGIEHSESRRRLSIPQEASRSASLVLKSGRAHDSIYKPGGEKPAKNLFQNGRRTGENKALYNSNLPPELRKSFVFIYFYLIVL